MADRQSSINVLAVILALVVGGLGGYFIGSRSQPAAMAVQQGAPVDTYSGTSATQPPTAVSGTPMAIGDNQNTITLMAQNDSGQSGTAVLTEESGKVKIVLSLKGGTFTDPQPAHIHLGSCPKPGDVLYPLTNVIDGKSETTLDTTLSDLRSKGALAINVHKSASEIDSYTACGDIK